MNFFRQQTALITGAAQGLGKSLATMLYSYDCELVLVDKNIKALESFQNERSQNSRKIHIYEIDLLNEKQLSTELNTILKKHPNLNIVINNAGNVFPGYFHEVSLDQHKRTFDLNLMSLLQVSHTCLPHLRQKKSSRLVQIASASAFLSFPKASSYAASKWAVLGLSETLFAEQELLGLNQPKITVACPSFIQTRLFAGAKDSFVAPSLNSDRLAKKILKAVAKGQFRLSEPFLVKFVPLIKALLPFVLWQKLLKSLGVYESMSSWKGQSH